MTEPQILRPDALADDRWDWTGRWRGREVWELLTAARDGDVPRLSALIDRDPSIVHARFWYVPPIHFAVREGHSEATRLLVDAGANLAHRSLYGGDTLLRMATDRGHVEVADYLREQSRTRDTLGRSPLHDAVEAGRRDGVELVLAHGAEIDATGFGSHERFGAEGFRPVVLALWHHPYWSQRNDYEMARLLIDRGADYSLTVAAALGDETRVRQLLEADPTLANDQESGGKRPLSAAAERNHASIVRLLLDAGADPNLAEGEYCPRGYALWAAAHFGYREIAEALLDRGADPNAVVESSGTPTEVTTDAETRALLYRHGGRVSLASHFWRGSIDTIAALFDASPALFDECCVAEGFAYCVSAGHAALLRLLLARGLRVPPVVTECQTYLWERPELTRILLAHGLDPDLPNWQQIRPLHHMAARGEIEKAELFLEFGADIDAVDEEYRSTPLGWAARSGQTEFVRFLLTKKANASSSSTPSWSRPIAWATRRGHTEIVDLLK